VDSEEESEDKSGHKKRSTSITNQGCTCSTGCKTKRCSCRKAGPHCTALCKCNHSKCSHREVPGTDVSSAVETDKENASMDSEDNDNTKELLENTFDIPPTKLEFAATLKSPMRRSPLKPLFKTPVICSNQSSSDMFDVDSDIEATPTNVKVEHGSYFASPQF